jgi:hypothetical protein
VAEVDQGDVARFRAILQENDYQCVFFRYLVGAELIDTVSDALPEAAIIVDADMLSSRIAAQAWRQNRSIRNRYYLIGHWKLRRYERRLFAKPYLFLMSNSEERRWVRNNYLGPGAKGRLAALPNAMPELGLEKDATQTESKQGYILFHGVLGSAVNTDAYRYLTGVIYPRIHETLERHGVTLRIVGKGLSAFHETLAQKNGCTRTELVGEVDDIGAEIRNALFCVVPLRIGSGTKTRILEAAAYGKVVVTTPIGAEGLDLPGAGMIVREDAAGLAKAIAELIVDSSTLPARGEHLQQRCSALYSEAAVSAQLLQIVENEVKRVRAASDSSGKCSERQFYGQ